MDRLVVALSRVMLVYRIHLRRRKCVNHAYARILITISDKTLQFFTSFQLFALDEKRSIVHQVDGLRFVNINIQIDGRSSFSRTKDIYRKSVN